MDGRRDFSAEQDPSWYPDDRGYDGGQWRDGEDRYPGDGPVPDPRDGGHDRRGPAGGSGGRRYADPLEPDRLGGGDYPERRPVDPADPLRVGDPLGVSGRAGRSTDTDPGRSGGFGRAAEFPVIGGRPADGRTEPDDERVPGHARDGGAMGLPTGQLPITTGPDGPDGGATRYHTQPIDRQDLRRPGPAGAGGAGFGAPGAGGFDPGAPAAAPGAVGSPGVSGPAGGVYGPGTGNESVYRSRRPLHAVVLAAVTVLLEIVALRVLLNGVTASPVGTPAVVAGTLLLIGLPVFAAGLYGVATGAAALGDPSRAWLRPPGGYLLAGLVLLLSAAVAAG